MTVTARESRASGTKAPVEAALRHLGSWRYDDLVGRHRVRDQAARRPYRNDTGAVRRGDFRTAGLDGGGPCTRCLESARGRHSPSARRPPAMSRRRRVLQAAFRLPDKDIEEPWGASLTERFKQLGALAVFSNATSTQPMEIAWKRGVERLADHLERELKELRTPEDWARHRPVQTDDSGFAESTDLPSAVGGRPEADRQPARADRVDEGPAGDPPHHGAGGHLPGSRWTEVLQGVGVLVGSVPAGAHVRADARLVGVPCGAGDRCGRTAGHAAVVPSAADGR